MPRSKARSSASSPLCHLPVMNVRYPADSSNRGRVGTPSILFGERIQLRPVSTIARLGTQTAPLFEPNT